ncbi:palmdelphin [Protopterus annectens]|uniref:palmdelphin n=1 Tax=Protopterus annectens TaxID=7888 RepID=UPI001CF9917B|nr:palmdelphin [Protopterus annectens]XP_043941554.1 palmdelphin [Protopterus annectens]XP_043941555.1 palmdelphin [Protopterus annectens]
MEEDRLMKERLQAITDKRKLQEEIAQKRLQVEEEKQKLQHIKKKALREKWLLDGLSQTTPEQDQTQNDQARSKLLEQDICKLEKEIQSLERQELEISANEETILKKLKAVEKTAEDIIKAVKAEADEESIEYTYSKIQDLPPYYVRTPLEKGEGSKSKKDYEENKKALIAMEINVEKDLLTGESTILSTAPVTHRNFKERGIKVFDDGRKSIFAVCSDGGTLANGVEQLSPFQVEDLLRKATESKHKSPLKHHESGYSSQKKPTAHQMPFRQLSSPTNQEHHKESTKTNPNVNRSISAEPYKERKTIQHDEDGDFNPPTSPAKMSHFQRPPMMKRRLPSNRHLQDISSKSSEPQVDQNKLVITQIPHQDANENYSGNVFVDSIYSNGRSTSAFEEDVKYNIVQEMPSNIKSDEPVTMIFMGYQHVDDEEEITPASTFEGAIRAELVVIADDEDDDVNHTCFYSSESPCNQTCQPPSQLSTGYYSSEARINLNMNNISPYKMSTAVKTQKSTINSSFSKDTPDEQLTREVSEDPSLSALRMRMAKLGKRVI